MIVPEAPAARFSGLGLVPVSEQTGDVPNHVPVLVITLGGLEMATMPFCAAVEIFFIVITMRKLCPAATALVSTPAVV